MRGRRHHIRHLSQRLAQVREIWRAEWQSTLQLVFKRIPCRHVETALEPQLTVCLTELSCTAWEVSASFPAVRVSDDPIASLARQAAVQVQAMQPEQIQIAHPKMQSHDVSLVLEKTEIRNTPLSIQRACGTALVPLIDGSCQVVKRLPMLIPPTGCVSVNQVPIQVLTATCKHPAITALSYYKTKARQVKTGIRAACKRAGSNLLSLPIRRAPIPPHRFPSRIREWFRQRLAEKAGTSSGNIQLRMVFDRVDPAWYEAIRPDAQGFLLCTPRLDAQASAGYRLPRPAALQPRETMAYLVFGFRLDNREDVHDFAPIALLPDANME